MISRIFSGVGLIIIFTPVLRVIFDFEPSLLTKISLSVGFICLLTGFILSVIVSDQNIYNVQQKLSKSSTRYLGSSDFVFDLVISTLASMGIVSLAYILLDCFGIINLNI